MSATPPRAAIYGRLSSDIRLGTERGGENVDYQVDKAKARAAERGYEVVEVFRENDTTAGGYRPVYEKLRRKVADGAFDVVVVHKTDRLYRKVRELEDLIDLAEKIPQGIEAVEEGRVDLATRDGRTQARLRVTLAEDELDRIRERVTEGKRRSKMKGYMPGAGRRPYGHEVEYLYDTAGEPTLSKTGKHKFRLTGRLDEKEAAAIRAGAEMILAGDSLAAVGRYWQTQGIAADNGRPIPTASIRGVLLNPRNSGRVSDRIGTSDRWVIHEDVEAKWPAILDPETQERVRLVLSDPARRNRGGRSRKDGRPNNVYWLTPTVVCSNCGRKLVSSYSRDGSKANYECQKARSACGRTTISKRKLEGFVLEELASAISTKAGRKALLSRLVASNSEAAAEMADLEAKIEAVGHKRREIQAAIVDDTIPVSDGKALLVALADERDRYDEARSQLLAAVSNVDSEAVETVDWVAENGVGLFAEALDGRRKREFARLVFEKVEVDPNGGRSKETPASERVRLVWRNG